MLRISRALSLCAALAAGFAMLATAAEAQNAQRKCQTVLTCNYSKGGSYRGCLSSYSCRQCRFVAARCSVGSTSGRCQKLVCGWGA